MNKIKAIRKFLNEISLKPVVIANKKMEYGNMGIDMNPENSAPRLFLPKDFTFNDEDDKLFRKNFIKKCKLARGFSNVTLSLLHEMGHWETRSVFDIIAYSKIDQKVTNQEEYLKNPYEQLATQWAICWLQVPQNRQLAKKFEKNFFGH